jgi:hypothetical protein
MMIFVMPVPLGRAKNPPQPQPQPQPQPARGEPLPGTAQVFQFPDNPAPDTSSGQGTAGGESAT